MSIEEQNPNLKTSLRLQENTVYEPAVSILGEDEGLSVQTERLSALEELSFKIDLCLKKQKQVHFITKEISEIIKKST